jgi:hypothetical protein
LKRSALISVSVASALRHLAAQDQTDDAAGHSPFYLPPFLALPTGTSIVISVMNGAQPVEAVLEYRAEGADAWKSFGESRSVPAYEFLNWELQGLVAATRYRYRLLARSLPAGNFAQVEEGSFITQRKGPSSYTAVLITDPHVGSFGEGSGPLETLDTVAENASREHADFALALGDNVAWPGSREFAQTENSGAVRAYAMYRRHVAKLTRNCPHFGIIGNWEGESGKFPASSIRIVAEVRRAFLPNPNHQTYPQGGSEGEDYYAFSWGDALFVMLNIQTYSQPSHPEELSSPASDVGRVEDWTIGEAQMQWLEATLENATERFRFVCMHHPAGGNAGSDHQTLYGRGGGRAWNCGEQLKIHGLMKRHGVQVFFYGHDHVFVDDVVDGIHYALPGSCGAPWKFTKAETGYERYWTESGHARLEVTPTKATVTFVNLAGQAFHEFTVLPFNRTHAAPTAKRVLHRTGRKHREV